MAAGRLNMKRTCEDIITSRTYVVRKLMRMSMMNMMSTAEKGLSKFKNENLSSCFGKFVFQTMGKGGKFELQFKHGF